MVVSLKDVKPISEWISSHYGNAEKIVEIGVGKSTDVLLDLEKALPECELIGIDIRESQVPEGVRFEMDDVSEPDLDIYEGSDLIYSIRTPYELYKHILKLAKGVGADVLVKPLNSEEIPSWGKLVNYSGISFYLWEKD